MINSFINPLTNWSTQYTTPGQYTWIDPDNTAHSHCPSHQDTVTVAQRDRPRPKGI
ncbi:hypothetical protein H6F46_04115 [Limnothrix sp. FACHB-1083]|uniref:hypothetical protein n=1 Tax=unclassified Limnothrix TaxID=2632864 RepID=UPI001680F7B0|nr:MULTISPECIES: hypothetical protein [unclassified Limnothrix]MBD2159874.1 hypothetical protein [Limnothrix sp. FACHB-1083]MBD2190575.1 hypothetical protein [Limnothrix sp. FACHB-1088]